MRAIVRQAITLDVKYTTENKGGAYGKDVKIALRKIGAEVSGKALLKIGDKIYGNHDLVYEFSLEPAITTPEITTIDPESDELQLTIKDCNGTAISFRTNWEADLTQVEADLKACVNVDASLDSGFVRGDGKPFKRNQRLSELDLDPQNATLDLQCSFRGDFTIGRWVGPIEHKAYAVNQRLPLDSFINQYCDDQHKIVDHMSFYVHGHRIESGTLPAQVSMKPGDDFEARHDQEDYRLCPGSGDSACENTRKREVSGLAAVFMEISKQTSAKRLAESDQHRDSRIRDY